jgi:hypothetical protein
MMDTMDDYNTRLQDFYTVEEQTWTSKREVGAGIWVYSNVLPPSMGIPETLESVLQDQSNPFDWQIATVGYMTYMPEYRDCYDFKYISREPDYDTSVANQTLKAMYNATKFRQLQALKDYAVNYRIGDLRYWEATNFVKYGPNQHFQEHHDHGFSYNCTVSMVSYPNDNYSGGEINFRLQGVTYKPEAGDCVIFPSNFMYPHRALPVHEGTKYSLVTMIDYSDKYHRPELYQETGS